MTGQRIPPRPWRRSPGTRGPYEPQRQFVCVLGQLLDEFNAVNRREAREKFEVAMAGPNGYVNFDRAPVEDYAGVCSRNAAIDGLLGRHGGDRHFGFKIFNYGYYDPGKCGAACNH